MKKYILCAMALWFSLLCIQVSAKTNDKVAYTIYYGSDTRNTYQIKEDVRQIFNELTQGVNKDSYAVMVMNNIEAFQVINNVNAKWENDRLVIIVGDGEGTFINGTLKHQNICVDEVKPKSLLQEIFN